MPVVNAREGYSRAFVHFFSYIERIINIPREIRWVFGKTTIDFHTFLG